ncbi:etoposide-induced protein 2.4-domain-containing protein, partial [Umbelopsis sp. PMI_123]
LYFVCIALNGRFNKRIADHTYQIQLNQGTATSSSPVQNVAYAIYQMLFYGSCAAFLSILQMIPQIGTIVSFIVSCWFMSYYCFEFKWINLGLTMDQRMSSLERHWAFFLGFGIPLTTLTFFLSSLRAAAVYAIFFPSFVIMATTAVVQPPLSPRTHGIPSGNTTGWKDIELPDRLPIFTGVKKLNEILISFIRKFGGVRGDSLLLDKKKEAFGKLV